MALNSMWLVPVLTASMAMRGSRDNAGEQSKTEIVHFTSRFKQCDAIPGILIKGVIIPPVPVERDLGTILDCHLKLNTHVNNICKTAHYAIRSISRFKI